VDSIIFINVQAQAHNTHYQTLNFDFTYMVYTYYRVDTAV